MSEKRTVPWGHEQRPTCQQWWLLAGQAAVALLKAVPAVIRVTECRWWL